MFNNFFYKPEQDFLSATLILRKKITFDIINTIYIQRINQKQVSFLLAISVLRKQVTFDIIPKDYLFYMYPIYICRAVFFARYISFKRTNYIWYYFTGRNYFPSRDSLMLAYGALHLSWINFSRNSPFIKAMRRNVGDDLDKLVHFSSAILFTHKNLHSSNGRKILQLYSQNKTIKLRRDHR